MPSEIEELRRTLAELNATLKGNQKGNSSSAFASGVTGGIAAEAAGSVLFGSTINIVKSLDGVGVKIEQATMIIVGQFEGAMGLFLDSIAEATRKVRSINIDVKPLRAAATQFQQRSERSFLFAENAGIPFHKMSTEVRQEFLNKHGGAAYQKERRESIAQEALKNKTTSGTISNLNLFGAALRKAVPLLAGVGVLAGLRDTVEGNTLQYELSRLSYELADLVRGPLRWFIEEMHGAANVMHAFNAGSSGTIRNPVTAALTGSVLGLTGAAIAGTASGAVSFGSGITHQLRTIINPNKEAVRDQMQDNSERILADQYWKQDGNADQMAQNNLSNGWFQHSISDERRKQIADLVVMEKERNKNGQVPMRDYSKDKKPDDHITPIMHASFEAFDQLQNKMQALISDNPIDIQKRELTMIELIYNLFVEVAHRLMVGQDYKTIEIPKG